ncbi:hypothetical protein EVAR_95123_1 [Eumeta japonica]|uniref:Uncharacterized protein n=1 Tax=Eumeta variegata TaxID=151549 RepID=A0A4C1W5X9_EUMVA|nr:hypothetical protein EVAR_95123_1 [Eumeta japonica]
MFEEKKRTSDGSLVAKSLAFKSKDMTSDPDRVRLPERRQRSPVVRPAGLARRPREGCRGKTVPFIHNVGMKRTVL